MPRAQVVGRDDEDVEAVERFLRRRLRRRHPLRAQELRHRFGPDHADLRGLLAPRSPPRGVGDQPAGVGRREVFLGEIAVVRERDDPAAAQLPRRHDRRPAPRPGLADHDRLRPRRADRQRARGAGRGDLLHALQEDAADVIGPCRRGQAQENPRRNPRARPSHPTSRLQYFIHPNAIPTASPPRWAALAIGPKAPVKQSTSQPSRRTVFRESILSPSSGWSSPIIQT